MGFRTMDAWEWNKLAAAVLGALVLVLSLHFIARALFSVAPPARPAYVPAVIPASPTTPDEPDKPAVVIDKATGAQDGKDAGKTAAPAHGKP